MLKCYNITLSLTQSDCQSGKTKKLSEVTSSFTATLLQSKEWEINGISHYHQLNILWPLSVIFRNYQKLCPMKICCKGQDFHWVQLANYKAFEYNFFSIAYSIQSRNKQWQTRN